MILFWTLAIVLRTAEAVRPPFSVNNDLLAFPQFDIEHARSHISRQDANSLLDSGELQEHYTDGTYTHAADQDGYEHDYVQVISRGKPHICAIPHLNPEGSENDTASAQSAADKEKELIRASNHGWELLESMRGNCIYYPAGWWVYSFCHDEGIRQFHPLPIGGKTPNWPPKEDRTVPSFVLGTFDKPLRIESDAAGTDGEIKALSAEQRDSGKALSSQVHRQGEANFLVQRLGGGTVCDLTGAEREITIQFHCNPGAHDRIALIKETASCVYLMAIHTPRLCGDVAFLPPQAEKPNRIICTEIVADNDLGAWKAVKAAEAAHDLMTQRDAGKYPLVIGGIEVGAQQLVGGSPERTIKPGNIVKPPQIQLQEQERFIATLASSDGKSTTVLNEKEIRKLGLKNTVDDVAETIDKVDDIAKGQPWRLEIVQAPTGMQMKAIIGDDSGDAEEEDSPRKHERDRKSEKARNGADDEQGSEEEYRKKPDL